MTALSVLVLLQALALVAVALVTRLKIDELRGEVRALALGGLPDPLDPVPQGDGDHGEDFEEDPDQDVLFGGEGGAWTKAARERRNWR